MILESTTTRAAPVRLTAVLILATAACCIASSAVEVSVARGDLASLEGRTADAVAAYRDALAQDPRSPGARLRLGQSLLALDRVAEAVAELEAVVGLNPSSDDAQIVLSRAHLRAGNAERALSLLEGVRARAPKRTDLGVEIAQAYLKAGRASDALAALDAGTTGSRSSEDQARLLRGVALARLGRRRQALDVLDVLARSDAEPDLARVAGRFRDQVRAGALDAGAGPWSGWVKLGLQFDDNPVIAPTTNVFGLRDFRVESPGATLSGGVTRVLDRRADRRIATSYNFLQTVNVEVNEVNLQDHMLDIEGSWALDRRGVLGLRAAYDNLLIDETSLLQRFSLAPSWSFAGRGRTTTQLAVRFEHKDFLNNAAVTGTVEDRDADNLAASVVRAFPLHGDRGAAQVGLLFDSESARGRNLDYQGRMFFVGFAGALPRTRLTYTSRAQIHLRDYDNVHSAFLKAREDKELSSFAALSYPLSGQRVLSFEQTLTRNESNLALFDFERAVHAVTMRWKF